jgi:hypothetical protein
MTVGKAKTQSYKADIKRKRRRFAHSTSVLDGMIGQLQDEFAVPSQIPISLRGLMDLE